MTSSKSSAPPRGRAAGRSTPKVIRGAVKKRVSRSSRPSASWLLQDAKARFSELVRRAKTDGPQRVTVHGREEVVVISAAEYRRLKGERSGASLIEAMQASPNRDLEIAPARSAMPVRAVDV